MLEVRFLGLPLLDSGAGSSAALLAGTLAKIGELIASGETPDELPVHVIVGLTSLA
ncbi:MAG TPA: hypothetical protein VGI26_10685 [Solirubrobacteraceae bacterium]